MVAVVIVGKETVLVGESVICLLRTGVHRKKGYHLIEELGSFLSQQSTKSEFNWEGCGRWSIFVVVGNERRILVKGSSQTNLNCKRLVDVVGVLSLLKTKEYLFVKHCCESTINKIRVQLGRLW